LIAAILGLPGLGLMLAGWLLKGEADTAGREVARYRNLLRYFWGTRYCITYYRSFCGAFDRHCSLDLWSSVALNIGWILVLYGIVVLAVALLTQALI